MLVWFASRSMHPPLCHHPPMWYPYIHLGGTIWMTIMVFISCVQRMLSPFCQYEEYFLSPIPQNIYNILPFIVSRCECCFFFRGEGVPLPLLFASPLQIFVIIGVAFCAWVMNVTFSFYNMHPPFGKLALLLLLWRCRQSPLHLVFTHMVSTRRRTVISSRTQNLTKNS